MGHKETMTVATEEKGGGTLRRMILVLAAATLMAAMMVAQTSPAFAAPGGTFGSPQDDKVNETFPGDGANHKPLRANPADQAQNNTVDNCFRHDFIGARDPAQCQ
jgi:hypothetical protein